jgi:Putative auto-transporter adhesin, head GIN domain
MKQMKTSKILLLVTAILFLIAFVVFSVILKHSITDLQKKSPIYSSYEKLPSEVFHRLKISKGLKVRIRQGKICRLEIGSSQNLPIVGIANGILSIRLDSSNRSKELLPVRITMPALDEIHASGPTHIHLGFFQSDSIHVKLLDSCVFESDNNQLKRISFETSGHTQLVFKEMMP